MKVKDNTIKINIIFILAIVFLFAIIFAKMCYISLNQVVEGTNLKELSSNRTKTTKTISASRGSIYDINNNILATNTNSYTLIAYLDSSRTTDERYPNHVVDKENTAKVLSEILEPINSTMTYEYILSRLNLTGKYQVEFGSGGKNISEITKSQIDSYALPGIDFTKSTKRYYPYGDFASYIIGYAKKNEETGEIKGELGIEAYTDRYLSGTDGEIVYEKDRYGYQLANGISYTTKEVKDGYDVYLTLDSQVQMFLDNAISEISNYNIDWATITVADAKTGAIIGSSSNPSYNPNTLNITNYNNPLTSYTYEPGSTMKIFSFASSIEEGLYDGSKTYESGSRTIDDYTITDWNHKGWGTITYDVGFTYSSNIAAINLAEKLGKEKLTNYYTSLGFGSKTGIELANEYSGDISIEYRTELATASYGQGITVTPIQIIQALTTLTNDGTVLKPYIIDKIVDPSTGEVIYQGGKKELNKVYSTSTINKMIELMDETVNGSDSQITGKSYATSSVRLIGKTGTSYYVESGQSTYTTGEYKNIRSFAGVFPKDDPEYIIYVAVKDFHGTSSNLGNIIKNLVESVAKYKNLDERESNRDETKIVTIPNITNFSTSSAIDAISNNNLNPVVIGDGNKIIKYYPEYNTTVEAGASVFLLTNGDNITMPDMYGWSSKEANDYCSLAGIKCNFTGYGYVNSTSKNVGDIINVDEEITINLVAKCPASLTDNGGDNNE